MKTGPVLQTPHLGINQTNPPTISFGGSVRRSSSECRFALPTNTGLSLAGASFYWFALLE